MRNPICFQIVVGSRETGKINENGLEDRELILKWICIEIPGLPEIEVPTLKPQPILLELGIDERVINDLVALARINALSESLSAALSHDVQQVVRPRLEEISSSIGPHIRLSRPDEASAR